MKKDKLLIGVKTREKKEETGTGLFITKPSQTTSQQGGSPNPGHGMSMTTQPTAAIIPALVCGLRGNLDLTGRRLCPVLTGLVLLDRESDLAEKEE